MARDGLSDELKADFPNIIPVNRPLVENQNILSPYWVSGFTAGEGCFYVAVSKSSSDLIEYNIRLRFILSQQFRDEQLMNNFIAYFNCGNCEKAKDGMVYFKVTKFKDNYEKIQSFFSKYQLDGIKANDFHD